MAIETIKWRPRGPVFFGTRDETTTPAGPGPLGSAQCVRQISLSLNIDYIISISKCFGIDSEDQRDIKSLQGEGTIDFGNYTPEAIALALGATTIEAEGSPASVVAEELPIVVEGNSALLGGPSPNFNVTALSIVDSSTAPQTLVLNTDYTVNLPFGMVAFGDVSGFTQPFKASYSHQNPKIFAALTAGRVVRWIRFNGINIVNSNVIVPVDIFKAQISPTTSFELEPDDYGNMSLKFAIQADLSREATDPRGQYYYQGNGVPA